MKLSIIATSRCLVEYAFTNIANSVYPDQTDRFGSIGYVSTLIESILSTEWQCLKNKTGMYKAITILKCVTLLTLTCRNLCTEASSIMRALSGARCTGVRLYTLCIKIGTNQRALGEHSHY